MPKTTEQKFQLHANFWFEISIQDLRDLFCTMGQGSSYWCHDMVVGDIKRDSDGFYLLEDKAKVLRSPLSFQTLTRKQKYHPLKPFRGPHVTPLLGEVSTRTGQGWKKWMQA